MSFMVASVPNPERVPFRIQNIAETGICVKYIIAANPDDSTASEIMKADRASKGGAARMQKLSRAERQALASSGAKARWQRVKNKSVKMEAGIESSRATELPEAQYPGVLNFGGTEIPVYVLSNGQRVIARVAATEYLSDIKRGGDLESYIRVASLQSFPS